MTVHPTLTEKLLGQPKVWLVTGVAGFIGSNLLETLLRLDQKVIGLDNFATGSSRNFEQVRALVGPEKWGNFRHILGDILEPAACQRASQGADYVLHQAALGSVPRSIAHPLDAHANNVTGFLNLLIAARDHGVRRLVYASSSAVYGDHPGLPKVEDKIGQCLSPYAATKRANELYAETFARCYNLQTMGLRYFNVFEPTSSRPPRRNPKRSTRFITSPCAPGPLSISSSTCCALNFCLSAPI